MKDGLTQKIADALVDGTLKEGDIYAYQFLIANKDELKDKNKELIGLEVTLLFTSALNRVTKFLKEVK